LEWYGSGMSRIDLLKYLHIHCGEANIRIVLLKHPNLAYVAFMDTRKAIFATEVLTEEINNYEGRTMTVHLLLKLGKLSC
jgi:hypothetical protein